MPVLAPVAPHLLPPVPQRRLWTRAEFYRLADLGFFQGQRAELLEGEIVVQSPQNWPHTSTNTRIFEILRTLFLAGFWVRMQLPLSLGLKSDPEPDVSVVTGRFEDYLDHPSRAVLVVEVSDSTLALDKSIKASIYAAAQIQDYWIADVANQRMIILRNPKQDPTQAYGWTYADVLIRDLTANISPLAIPSVTIRVADLFG